MQKTKKQNDGINLKNLNYFLFLLWWLVLWFLSSAVEVNRWYNSCFVQYQQIFIHSLRLFLHGTSLLLFKRSALDPIDRSPFPLPLTKFTQGRTVFCLYITLRWYFTLEMFIKSASFFNLKENKNLIGKTVGFEPMTQMVQYTTLPTRPQLDGGELI